MVQRYISVNIIFDIDRDISVNMIFCQRDISVNIIFTQRDISVNIIFSQRDISVNIILSRRDISVNITYLYLQLKLFYALLKFYFHGNKTIEVYIDRDISLAKNDIDRDISVNIIFSQRDISVNIILSQRDISVNIKNYIDRDIMRLHDLVATP